MSVWTPLVASEISKLEEMSAKWNAGCKLSKEEFDEICRQREKQLKEFKEHIDRVAQAIANLEKMRKKAFVDMVAAQNALQAAKAKLRAAKPGTSEESAAQADVDRYQAEYQDARSRCLKIDAEKKKKEKLKEELDKLYEQWKDALDSFKRRGEQRLLELYRHGQKLDAQTQKAIQLTKSGMSRGA